MASAELLALDAAMMRLRRVWAVPPARSPKVPDGMGHVDLSTVLVVEACARGSEEATTTVADVATFAGVAPSTASRFVTRAVEAGMVTREQQATDGRRAAVGLTDAGRALHGRGLAVRLERLRSTLEGWTDAEVLVFVDLLGRFAEAAVDPARGAPLVPSYDDGDDA
ncbi:MarR family winged helix-turn-helix transcriptional regulator [Actinomycetospora sp. CA-101289]|uniref:MarR family winged helix-turn-helix transcriptional regulator n=1 Tax=Actinomycetospora sp. CA-101289 TaxID=3239893 RepID=UPI003D9511A6